jgi:hypothetical protein
MLFKAVNPSSSDEAPHSKVSPASFVEKACITEPGALSELKRRAVRDMTQPCVNMCTLDPLNSGW